MAGLLASTGFGAALVAACLIVLLPHVHCQGDGQGQTDDTAAPNPAVISSEGQMDDMATTAATTMTPTTAAASGPTNCLQASCNLRLSYDKTKCNEASVVCSSVSAVTVHSNVTCFSKVVNVAGVKSYTRGCASKKEFDDCNKCKTTALVGKTCTVCCQNASNCNNYFNEGSGSSVTSSLTMVFATVLAAIFSLSLE